MTEIRIRPFQTGDEIATAKVHIQSWQEAYKGLIPQFYLDNLPSELESRTDMWRQIAKHPKRWAWVAEDQSGIIGFSLFGPARDTNKEGYIELGAIYLLSTYKGKGIGYSLLKTGYSQMRQFGFQKSYCWVLENNPTIKFYEKTGAKFNGDKKQDEIGGVILNELAYEWSALNFS